MSKEIIVKIRDDREPVKFDVSSESPRKFKPQSGAQHSWGNESEFGSLKLRRRIEPWLTALFQSEHFSLLVGTGLTYAICSLAGQEDFDLPTPNFGKFQQKITDATEVSDKKQATATIEKQLNVANELLTGLRHLQSPEEDINSLRCNISKFLGEFSRYILGLESNISTSTRRDEAFGFLVNFLMSFASRSGTRERLQIFTTNYDRVIEAGAETAGLHLLDRFVGNIAPIFRSSRLNIDMHYNPPGIRGEPRYLEGVACFTKLHGSIDWINAGKDIRRIGLPFGAESIEPHLHALGIEDDNFHRLMIYPNSAKDKETAEYPYVELFRDFATSVCRPNSSLVTYGYGFGDDHINRVIADMLTIPSTHLVIISNDDPLGRIMKFYENLSRPAQTTILIGEHFGDLKSLVSYYLPKPAIDRITIRMADLLKSRLTAIPERDGNETVGDET